MVSPRTRTTMQRMRGDLRAERLTPLDAVERSLEAIRRQDGEIQAWKLVDAEGARAAARALAQQKERPPLYGIPFGVKDIFDTADLPTGWGSPLYADRVPRSDALLVARLRGLGAIVLGKTHTTAFAYFDAGPTCNPHDLKRTPGGSSSGSAAAVAAGMVPFAIGSQTMGSVLRPASFCGVVGLKPSYGKLPLEGVLPFAPSLDHAGFFTMSVEDLQILWRALFPDAKPGTAARRLAVLDWPLEGELEPAMRDGFSEALDALSRAGFEVRRAAPPESFKGLPAAILDVLAYEAAGVHRERFARHGDKIGVKLAELVDRGLGLPQRTYDEARAKLAAAKNDYAAWSERHPAAATPAALGPAPLGIGSTGDPRANAPWTALGVPAISIPCAETAQGLPLGLQLAAGPGEDELLIETALACEQALAASGAGGIEGGSR